MSGTRQEPAKCNATECSPETTTFCTYKYQVLFATSIFDGYSKRVESLCNYPKYYRPDERADTGN